MKRMTICLIVLFGFLNLVSAQNFIVIEKDNLVQNKPPGYCGWCCLEALGRHQGIKRLHGLVEKIPPFQALTHPSMIANKLNNLKVKFSFIKTGKGLEKACKTHACLVFMEPNPAIPFKHAVIICQINESEVRYYDPNGKKRMVASRQWFDRYWSRAAFKLEEGNASKSAQSEPAWLSRQFSGEKIFSIVESNIRTQFQSKSLLGPNC